MPLFGDINKVELLGNLTQDVELRFTPNGAAVASVSMATNRRYKQGEEYKDEVTFHNVVIWGNLAQGFAQRAKKGTRVLITGRIQTRSWDGNDGQKKYKTEIVAEDAILIDRYEKGKMDSASGFTGNAGGGSGMGGFSGGNSGGGSDDFDFGAGFDAAPTTNNSANNTGNSRGKQSAGAAAKQSSQNDDIVDPDDLPF